MTPKIVFCDENFEDFHSSRIETSIAHQFEKQVEKFPHKTAIFYKEASLTYHQLNHQANQIAREIMSRKKNTSVGIIASNNHITVVCVLAVAKLGMPFLLLDIDQPRERIKRIIEDSGAELLLTSTQHEERNLFFNNTICIENIGQQISGSNLEIDVSPQDVAYIVYTSGTTGTPKGVYHTNRSALHAIMRSTNSLKISEKDRWLLLVNASHTGGINGILRVLLNGATVILYNIKNEGMANLVEYTLANKATVLHAVLPLYRLFVRCARGTTKFPHIRLVLVGGETMYSQDVNLFQQNFSHGCKLVNQIGCTEFSTYSQYFIDHATKLTGNIVPVGYPCQDVKIYLVDDAGQQIKTAGPGKIVIESEFLALGYWNDTVLTQQNFENTENGRRYNTGDLARRLENGELLYLGRKDLQIKIRGNRVEISEIEGCLREITSIEDARVIANKDKSGNVSVCAFLIKNSNDPLERDHIQQKLREKLPDYMIPQKLIYVDEFPLTANGKINEQKLKEMHETRASENIGQIAPYNNSVEKILLEIWQGVLKTQVGVDDNFFNCGGNSLLAIHVFDQIATRLKITMPISVLFHANTVRKLSTLFENQRLKNFEHCIAQIQPLGHQNPIFCVHGGGGEVLKFKNFKPYLSPDRPFYGIRAYNQDTFDIQKLALEYLTEISQVQPKGPYFLAGMCIGGIIAFEMAQVLVNQGETVAFLGILDSIHVPGMEGYKTVKQCDQSKKHVLRSYARSLWETFRRLTPEENILKLKMQKMKQFRKARDQYSPQIYPGDVTLFCNQQEKYKSASKARWAELTGGNLNYIVVPGNHRTMFEEPNVKFLVEEMQNHLNKAVPQNG